MDRWMRHGELEGGDVADQPVSRRVFMNRLRLGAVAMLGVAVFGVATTTSGVVAKESSDKKEKSKSDKKDGDENTSNTKKKKKNTNGDDSSKKKQKHDPAPPAPAVDPASPYARYLATGKDQFGCKDFPTQADAQNVLRIAPKDPNNLDGNRNGIACDGSDAFLDGVPAGLMGAPWDFTPVPRP